MSEKIRVDIEEVIKIKQRLREINIDVNFDDIIWYENGEPYVHTEEELVQKNSWKYIGMNNADYVWDMLKVDISGNHNKYVTLTMSKRDAE